MKNTFTIAYILSFVFFMVFGTAAAFMPEGQVTIHHLVRVINSGIMSLMFYNWSKEDKE